MKTIFRFLSLGMMLAAVTVVGTSTSFAQDVCSETDAQTKLQDTIRNTYAKDKPTAITAGKQLLEKYGDCEFSAEFVAWLKPQLPKWEESVKMAEVAKVRSEILKRFDTSIQNKNWAETYAAGSEFLSKFPNDPAKINVLMPLGLIGLYESYPPTKNYKFNDDTLRYAKQAIDMLKAGEKGTKNGKFGVFQFEFDKNDAISELTYALGYINYWAKGDKKTALPYYYEAIQLPGKHKDDPYAYATIAGYYADEAGRLGKDYAEKVKTDAPQPTDSPEVAAEKDKKLKEAEGILKGYLDRAIDAYSRAWKNTPATDKNKEALYKTVQDLYKLRFQKTDGLDAYIATTTAKPMPNPTSEVTPVIETEATPNTTTGSPAATVTKPVSMTTTAKATNEHTSMVEKPAAAPATTAKPAARKAPVKKGTR